MPPVNMRGDGRKAKNPKKTLLRLLGYMKPYLPTLCVVLVCIIVSAVAQTAGSRSLGTLVDSYILPMLKVSDPDFARLHLCRGHRFGFPLSVPDGQGQSGNPEAHPGRNVRPYADPSSKVL